jgi:hypothetical protein
MSTIVPGAAWHAPSATRATAFSVPARLSVLAAAATVVAGTATFLVPDLLRGTDVMNGSARGTALVLTVLTVPVLLVAIERTRHGSLAWRYAWLGALAHLTYNSVLLLFATPFNEAFLGYVAMLGLSAAALLALWPHLEPARLSSHCSAAMHRTAYAWFVGVIAAANAAVWLGQVVPALLSDETPAFLEGTGLTTSPTFVQDLAIWLPLLLVGAWWLHAGNRFGVLVVGAGLVGWTLEGVTVAVDQWFGHRADPTSDVASVGGSVLFAVLAVICLAVTLSFLHEADRREEG